MKVCFHVAAGLSEGKDRYFQKVMECDEVPEIGDKVPLPVAGNNIDFEVADDPPVEIDAASVTHLYLVHNLHADEERLVFLHDPSWVEDV